MARPKTFKNQSYPQWSEMLVAGGLRSDAQMAAEMIDAVRRAFLGKPPFHDEIGAALISFPAGKLLSPEEACQLVDSASEMLRTKALQGDAEFFSEFAKALAWMNGGREVYDPMAAAAFKIAADYTQTKGRFPTVGEMKDQLSAQGFTPPENWSRWANARPFFQVVEPGKRGADRAPRKPRAQKSTTKKGS